MHTSPSYALDVRRGPPPGYPTRPAPNPYSTLPGPDSFDERRRAYLAHCLANPAQPNTKGVWHELVRLQAGGSLHEGIVEATFDFIDARRDCSDFALHGVLRLLYQFAGHAQVSADVLSRARHTLLSFKYWPSEPGVDSLCTWTENHYILYASAAYLAGQLYPDEVFANSREAGRDKMAANLPRIRRWLDLRFKTGFSEWLSHVYYDEDLAALLSLADFCELDEVREGAFAVVDLLLVDIALNSFRGVFGSSHGRAYENTKKWASNEGTADTAKLLFGSGMYSGFDNMSAAAFALSPRFRLSPAIEAIARDVARPEMLNRQRMGIRVNEGRRWGLGFEDFEDGMAWLTLEAYLHPHTASLTMRMFDAFGWWENGFFAPFKRYRKLIAFMRRTGTLGPLARALQWDLCRNTREEVNVITYRTPDYMLSCAQDYRPGFGGDQQHIWQATLGPDAVCFTTHPAKRGGASPNYWAGSGVLPRAAQVKNVVIAIYHIHRRPSLYEPGRLPFTHAWLPRDAFDEVIEQGGWVFARKGEGYLALRSQQPYRWQAEAGEDRGREIIAAGRDNVWLCEMGRRATDGAFAAFAERILKAELRFGRLKVIYDSPGQGRLEFGWRGPLKQNGEIVSLDGYPRYKNPYFAAPFPLDASPVFAGRS